MNGWLWPVLIVSVLVLSGCVGPEGDGEEGGGNDGPVGHPPWNYAGGVSGCPESIGILVMEPERLQALLPENFTVRDAGDFFELGVETGQGVLFFNSVDCASGKSAEVAVYTSAPEVEGFEAADFDFYMLGYASNNSELVDNLTRVGMPAEDATVASTVEAASPVTASGSGEVGGEQAMTYTFEAIGSAPQPFELTARFWHEVPDGLVLWQYELPGQDAFAGALVSCTFPSGSLLAQIAGQEDCVGLQTAALLFPDQVFESEIRYLPGAWAGQ